MLVPQLDGARCSPSTASRPRTARCIRCSRRWSTPTRRNAASARRASRWRCSPSTTAAKAREDTPSTRRSPAISAAAPAIARSSMPAAALRAGPRDRFAAPRPRPPRRCARLPPARTIGTARRSISRRARSTNCSRDGGIIPTRCCYAGGTDLGLRVSKDREPFPGVISTARGRRAADDHRGRAGADDRRRRHLHAGAAASRPAFPGLRRAGAPHRLAPDPQSRHARRQSRQCLADRRHHSLPDRARCLGHARARRAGTRTLPADEFITGYRKTALAPGEVIAAIRIPLAGGRPTLHRLQALQALRPGHLDRDRRVPPRARRRQGARHPRRLWRHGGAHHARGESRSRSHRPRLDARCADADIDAALARDFTPMSDHRGSAAYRLRAAANLVRRLQARNDVACPHAGGGAYERTASPAFAAASTAPCAMTAPSAMSPAARSISTTCRSVAGTLEAALVLSPHAACPHPQHRLLAARSPRPASSRRSPPPTFPARTTSRRSAPTSRCSPPTWSSMRASRSPRSRRRRSIRRARPPSSSRSSTSRCRRC